MVNNKIVKGLFEQMIDFLLPWRFEIIDHNKLPALIYFRFYLAGTNMQTAVFKYIKHIRKLRE